MIRSKKKKKVQSSHHDGEKNGWEWKRNMLLHKKQHTIMGSFFDHAKVVSTMALRHATSSKALEALRVRQQSRLSGPPQRSMAKILMLWCHILVKLLQRWAVIYNLFTFQRPT